MRTRRIVVFFCFTLSLAVLSNLVQAQTFTVLHAFTGRADGAEPLSGVTIGGTGILYGTTYSGGTAGNGQGGVAFKLQQRGSGWELDPLYEFISNGELFPPLGPVTVRNGALYGTTAEYGGTGARGSVFELQPPPTVCKTSICYWNETVLHSFAGPPNDGAGPEFSNLVFDQAGNIYGTTERGGSGTGPFCGADGCGTVFELSPSGGGWNFNIIHNFQSNGIDGVQPQYGVVFDSAGSLYGTTLYGGISSQEAGTVFELTPSGGTWVQNILYSFFSNPLGNPVTATTLIMDQSGNLYGSTNSGGEHSEGTIYELTPSEGGWNLSTLYTFTECAAQPIAIDTAGNIYGTCTRGGVSGVGWVLELTNSGGSWTVTDLHDFTGGSDGGYPIGPVVFDSSGNLYGTASTGGISSPCPTGFGTGCGTVWEMTGVTDGLRR